MKTTAQKLIILAVIAMLGVTVNAQNTRSLRMEQYKEHISGYVSKKALAIRNTLSDQLRTLETAVRFSPANDVDLKYENEPFDLVWVQKSFENTLKYKPVDVTTEYEYMPVEQVLNEVLNGMEEVVKYQPAESYVSPDQAQMSEILEELSQVVKYQPSSGI